MARVTLVIAIKASNKHLSTKVIEHTASTENSKQQIIKREIQ